jgi:hypothetical protein
MFESSLSVYHLTDTISTCVETKPATDDGCQDQSVPPASGSTTTSNTGSISPSSIVREELKLAFQLRRFTFNELKCATRNFRPESLLGEGGFGCVFKGWIEENGTAPVKPGTGLTVAVKTLNHDGLQGHKEWVVRFCLSLVYFVDESIIQLSANASLSKVPLFVCRQKLIFLETFSIHI